MVKAIVLTICAAAEGFLLYALYHFVEEGERRRPARPLATVTVIGRRSAAAQQQGHAKAA